MRGIEHDAANRGAALWGSFVVSMANYPPRMIATSKETGKVVWETNLSDGQPGVIFSAAWRILSATSTTSTWESDPPGAPSGISWGAAP